TRYRVRMLRRQGGRTLRRHTAHLPYGLGADRPAAVDVDLILELLLELARHGTGPAYPAAHLAHDARQLLRSQHDERQDEDDQDLRESDVEHGRFSVETCGCRMSPDRRGALARLGRAGPSAHSHGRLRRSARSWRSPRPWGWP